MFPCLSGSLCDLSQVQGSSNTYKIMKTNIIAFPNYIDQYLNAQNKSS